MCSACVAVSRPDSGPVAGPSVTVGKRRDVRPRGVTRRSARLSGSRVSAQTEERQNRDDNDDCADDVDDAVHFGSFSLQSVNAGCDGIEIKGAPTPSRYVSAHRSHGIVRPCVPPNRLASRNRCIFQQDAIDALAIPRDSLESRHRGVTDVTFTRTRVACNHK